jgi:hypothetical protein
LPGIFCIRRKYDRDILPGIDNPYVWLGDEIGRDRKRCCGIDIQEAG